MQNKATSIVGSIPPRSRSRTSPPPLSAPDPATRVSIPSVHPSTTHPDSSTTHPDWKRTKSCHGSRSLLSRSLSSPPPFQPARRGLQRSGQPYGQPYLVGPLIATLAAVSRRLKPGCVTAFSFSSRCARIASKTYMWNR